MINGNEKAAPGKDGNLKNTSKNTYSLPDLSVFPSPAEVQAMPDNERSIFVRGTQLGIVLTRDSATAAGYAEGRQTGFDEGYARGFKDGAESAVQAHQDHLGRQARDAARPFVKARPYWEMCEQWNEPERAANALALAHERGLVA